MTADDVAQYLKENPDFFQQRAGLFTELLLPNPHEGNAVSLVERQSLLLRERVRALEGRLAELLQIGRDNDNLARVLVDWTKTLLAEPERGQLPRVASTELQRLFGVPLVEIRLWSQPPTSEEAPLAHFGAALLVPICGPQVDLKPIPGLSPAWAGVHSGAIIPLRRPDGSGSFGLIALGSSDPERFEAGLGTAVLARIGELASAALWPPGSGGAGDESRASGPGQR
jgi:uncharacterized protein YigA (DUF484 family)